MAKTNAKGRSRESRHVRLYRYMWEALLCRLDGNAFKALFYMLTFEEGSNNGQIFIGARMLSEGIGVDKKTALRCLQHLDRQGFIRPEELGYFTQKGGPASRWRFTFLPANGKPPTNEWRQPPSEEKSWGENFPGMGGKIGPAASVHRIAGGKIGPVEADPEQSMGEKSVHIQLPLRRHLPHNPEHSRAREAPEALAGEFADPEPVRVVLASLICLQSSPTLAGLGNAIGNSTVELGCLAPF